jgi:hypothetical protein
MLTKDQDRSIVAGAYTFDEKNHVHTLDGKPLTGVTTILGVIAKPMLIQWSANMAVDFIQSNYTEIVEGGDEVFEQVCKEARVAHRKKKESAGEFGTNVHNAIEKWVNMKILGVDIELDLKFSELEQKAFNHFVNWALTNNVKFLESEKHVYSRSLWVGGICDIVCEIDGKRYVADIKTSSGIYPEAFIQCSAYAEMLTEMATYPLIYRDNKLHNFAFDGVLILNCNKKGGFDHAFNYDIEGNFNCFKAAVTIYRKLNAIK